MERRRSSFDFLEAIRKPGSYTALFPPPEIGLAIAKLYAQVKAGAFPDGKFREADAINALQEADRLCFGHRERLPRERFISIIGHLQEYFIRYDEEAQIYTLKAYAEKFCEGAFEVLEADFNPTEIDQICSLLRNALEGCNTPAALAAWMDTPFETLKPKMKQQVDYLEHQLDLSITAISTAIRSDDADLPRVLKDIGEKLDLIRRQNAALQSAFLATTGVSSLLLEKLDAVSDAGIIATGKTVTQFFPQVKYSLRLIDSRLDRLQPRLRLFFNELGKPSFKKGMDKLLNFILEQSILVPYRGSKKIVFPQGVPDFSVRCGAPNFTIVESKDLRIPKPGRVLIRNNETAEIIAHDNRQLAGKLSFRNQVEAWLAKLRERCRQEGQVKFSEVFFQIVAQEDGQTDLACNVGYALLRDQTIRQVMTVTTTDKPVHHEAFKGLSVFEIKIEAVQ